MGREVIAVVVVYCGKGEGYYSGRSLLWGDTSFMKGGTHILGGGRNLMWGEVLVYC